MLRFSKLSCIMAPLLQEALFSSHFFKSYDTQLPSNKLLAYVVQNCLYMCNQKYLQSKYISLKENCIRNATCEMSKLISIIFRQTDCPYNQWILQYTSHFDLTIPIPFCRINSFSFRIVLWNLAKYQQFAFMYSEGTGTDYAHWKYMVNHHQKRTKNFLVLSSLYHDGNK